ncbi:MAG TPA: TetR/AcrR family transcriptional regulator [Frankiaceae bacterium]|nr:TetR/AcrR family transcriptional regulator [Frankiaceae bacterium]
MTRPARRLDNDERRNQLLAVGLDLFSKTSFDSVSIDEIAGRVGISRGLLYHYFASKRVFYVEIVRLAARDLLSRLGQGSAATAGERLRADLAAYLRFVDEHSAGFVTLLRGGIGSDPEVQQVLDETRTAIVRQVLDGLGLEVAPAPLEVALFGWVGYVESASLRWLTVPTDAAPPPEDLVDLFSQLLATTLEENRSTRS